MPPALLALEWSGKNIIVSKRVCVPVGSRDNIPYVLRGVIYYGSSHYVTVLVFGNGQLWHYDGMRNDGCMQLIGDLGSAPDLSHVEGKTAVAAIYIRDRPV